MPKNIMRFSDGDWYNVINSWEERLVQFEIIRKKVGAEWDLEIKVIGKITKIKGNTNWEEAQKF